MRNRYRGVYVCNENDVRVFDASVFLGVSIFKCLQSG